MPKAFPEQFYWVSALYVVSWETSSSKCVMEELGAYIGVIQVIFTYTFADQEVEVSLQLQ